MLTGQEEEQKDHDESVVKVEKADNNKNKKRTIKNKKEEQKTRWLPVRRKNKKTMMRV